MTLTSLMSVSSAKQEAHHLSHAHALYKASFFGPFRVTREALPLAEPTWRRNKARVLLKWFLLNPGDLFSMDQLCTLLWPDLSRKVATSNAHVTLHYLRHVLESELAAGCPSTFIRHNRYNYYWFDLHDVWWTDVFDVQYLSTHAREAERKGEFSRAIALSCQLVAYYNLTFLPEDIYEDMFSPYRRQHEYAYTQLLEHQLQLYTQTAQLDEALFCALHILSVDPYSEDAVKMIVAIQLQQGNNTGAIRQLDDFQNMLKEDLSIKPGKELLALRSSIMNAS
ncbi:MAG TPA: BTAD domain-containing putative transcriptional regulator [Ktedonosporobacter sp.]|nr:BTAD domain-containing putative transcriptional regulator [Ktedonosporobacter sp.]